MDILKILNKSFGVYNIKGIEVEPTYWMAGAIILLIFLLIFTLARLRFLYIHWSLGKGSLSFLLYGFLLAIIAEGFLLISGRTLFTELIGWKTAPKPIGTALDAGRSKLVGVLGAQDTGVETSAEKSKSYDNIAENYTKLTSDEQEKIKLLICK